MFLVFHFTITGGAFCWIFGIIPVDHFPNWQTVMKVFDHGGAVLLKSIEGLPMCMPVYVLEVLFCPGMFVAQFVFQCWFGAGIFEFPFKVVCDGPLGQIELATTGWKKGNKRSPCIWVLCEEF